MESHAHAVVPGAGPSLKRPGEWNSAVPPQHERSDRPWLVDAAELKRTYGDRLLTGLRRLHRRGELKLDGEWSHHGRVRALPPQRHSPAATEFRTEGDTGHLRR